MQPRGPIANLPTHEVVNVPPHQGDQDLWAQDIALQHWTNIHGGSIYTEYLADVGQTTGRYEIFEKGTKLMFTSQNLRHLTGMV